MKARVSDARREVARLRRSTIKAIRERDEDLVDSNLALYRELVIAFITRLRSYGATFDKKQAAREASAFPGRGWPELDWIVDDYRDVLEEAFNNPHRGILGSVLYFPTSVAAVSLHEGDFFTFYRVVLGFPGPAYLWASRLSDQSLREFAIDRIARYLSEFSRFHVAPVFERTDQPDEISRLRDIWEGLIIVFSDLLKAAFDRTDLPSFRSFMLTLNGLFDTVSDSISGYQNWLLLKDSTGFVETVPQESHTLYGVIQQALERLELLRNVTRLGLNAWITNRYASNLIEPASFKEWFEACGTFGDLPSLTRTYLAGRSFETQDLLRWSWWQLEGVENQVVNISLEHHLDRVYLLHGLNLVGDGPVNPDALAGSMPAVRDLSYLVDRPEAPLQVLLRELSTSADRWAVVLRVQVSTSADNLTRVLHAVVQRQRAEWVALVVQSPLDATKVQQFKEDILEGYRGASEIREFFDESGRYEFVEGGTGGWGQNSLLPKEIFVAGSNIMVQGFGRDYGAGVAQSLGERALDSIIGAITSVEDVPAEETIDALCRLGAELRVKGAKPSVALLRSWMTYTKLFNDKRFSPSPLQGSSSGREALIGILDGMSVYRLHWRREPKAIVGDFAALGIYRQLQPRPKPEENDELLGKELLFMLQPVTADLAARIIAKQPDFLKNPDSGEIESVEAATLRLRGRVHFRLFGNGEFVLERADAARSLSLTER
jgi:hypothetical protein